MKKNKLALRRLVPGLMLGMLLAAAATVRAAEPATTGTDPQPDTAALATAARPVAPTELQVEIGRLREQELATVAGLTAQIGQAGDPARRLELQRAVEAAKREGRLAVLGAQLRHACQDGDAQAQAAIEAAMAALRPAAADGAGR